MYVCSTGGYHAVSTHQMQQMIMVRLLHNMQLLSISQILPVNVGYCLFLFTKQCFALILQVQYKTYMQ